MRILNDQEIRRLEAVLHAGLYQHAPSNNAQPGFAVNTHPKTNAPPPGKEEPELPEPMSAVNLPVKQPNYSDLFGEKDGKGTAINSSDGDQDMLARLGSEIQAALTRQPGPPTAHNSASANTNAAPAKPIEDSATASIADSLAPFGMLLPASKPQPRFTKSDPAFTPPAIAKAENQKPYPQEEKKRNDTAIKADHPSESTHRPDANPQLESVSSAATNDDAKVGDKNSEEARPDGQGTMDRKMPINALPIEAANLPVPVIVRSPTELNLSTTQPIPTSVLPSGEQVAAVSPPSVKMPTSPAAVQQQSATSGGGELGVKSPSESDPFSTSESFSFRDGKVSARNGRKVKTTKPRITDAGVQALLSMNDPSVLVGIKVNEKGTVDSVTILRSSGSNAVDLPVYRAAFEWEVEPTLDANGNPIPNAFVINFVFH